MSFVLDYDRLIHLDAEELAERGIGEAYEALRNELQKYVLEPAVVGESVDDDAPTYSVTFGSRKFLIYGPGNEDEAWGRATFAFFTIINEQLAASGYRFYAVNGGNDLGGMFLRIEDARAAQDVLPDRTDWPYLPDDQPPWYGQFH